MPPYHGWRASDNAEAAYRVAQTWLPATPVQSKPTGL